MAQTERKYIQESASCYLHNRMPRSTNHIPQAIVLDHVWFLELNFADRRKKWHQTYDRVKKEYIRETEDDLPKTEDRNNK